MKKYSILLFLLAIFTTIFILNFQHKQKLENLFFKKNEYDAGYMNFSYYHLKFNPSFDELMAKFDEYEKTNILNDSLKLATIVNLYEEKLFVDLQEGLREEIFSCRVKVSNKKDVFLEKSIFSVCAEPLNFVVIKEYTNQIGTSDLVRDTSYIKGRLIEIELDSIRKIDGIQILKQEEITNELYIEIEYIASLEIPKEKLKDIFML